MPSWAPAGSPFENFQLQILDRSGGFLQTRSALSDCDRDSEASQRGGAMRNSVFFLRRNSEQWAGTRPPYYKHFLIFTFSRNCVALAVKPDALLFIRGPTVLQEPKPII